MFSMKHSLCFGFGDKEYEYNGYVAGNKVHYKLYPSNVYCQFERVLETNVARLCSMRIMIEHCH